MAMPGREKAIEEINNERVQEIGHYSNKNLSKILLALDQAISTLHQIDDTPLEKPESPEQAMARRGLVKVNEILAP